MSGLGSGLEGNIKMNDSVDDRVNAAAAGEPLPSEANEGVPLGGEFGTLDEPVSDTIVSHPISKQFCEASSLPILCFV